MVERKPDSAQIRSFLAGLEKRDWLRRDEREWWPRFVYHYTDIRNAARILQDGCLLSRNEAEEQGRLEVSSGSRPELDRTDPAIKDCVRLYFRPRTPTQYWAEGIQSLQVLSKSRHPTAHCPVPVFFLFDSAEILTRSDCEFSDGGLNASSAQRFSCAEELERLPWHKVYHIGYFDPRQLEQSDIAFRRNAEVTVPKRLDLEALRYILCRSAAEKDTLLHMLSTSLRSRYRSKISATARITLFWKKHTFVETAHLSSEGVRFDFSQDTESPGPFQLRIDLVDKSGREYLHRKNDFQTSDGLELDFSRSLDDYTVCVMLDGHLAYWNSYEKIVIPF